MRFSGKSAFALLAFCCAITIHVINARDYRSTTFQATLQLDGIFYTNIRVPRHAQRVRVKVSFQDECPWNAASATASLNSTSTAPLSQPTVLIRYDGVPRIDKFDASYVLPQYPESLEILDDAPSEAMLNIAVWGGALLNSYRYFAGTPEIVDIGIDVEIEACDSELQFGEDCTEQLQILPLSSEVSPTSFVFPQTHKQHSALMIPRGVDDVQVRATLMAESIGRVCDAYKAAAAAGQHQGIDTAAHVMQLTLQVYRNQPDEDRDSAKITAKIGVHAVCAPAATSIMVASDLLKPMEVLLERPIPGLWLVALELSMHSTPVGAPPSVTADVDNSNGQNALARNRQLASLLDGNAVRLEVYVETQLMQCPSGYTGRNDIFHVERFQFVPVASALAVAGGEGSMPRSSASSGEYQRILSNSTNINCQVPVIDLEVTRKPDPFRNVAHLWSRDTHLLQESYVRGPQGVISYARRDSRSVVSDASKELAREENGATIVESAELGADEQPYAAFAGCLEHTDINSILGGVLHVQLRVRPYVDELSRLGLDLGSSNPSLEVPAATRAQDLTPEQLQKSLEETTFSLGIRGGAMAGSPTSRFSKQFGGAGDFSKEDEDLNKEIEEKDYVDSLSENSITLSTRTATMVRLTDASATDEEGNLLYELPDMLEQSLPLPLELRYDHFLGTEDAGGDMSRQGLLYTWTVEKPAIHGLAASTFYSSRSLYVRVAKMEKTPLENFIVSIRVSFQPCAANSCGEKGLCYTRTGEVSVSACQCSYPYGGHDCNTLSIPYWFYLTQVGTLLLSNLAMVPAVLLCRRMMMPVIAAVLVLAACSSMMYHACDTDYYCMYNVDNRTLQLYDVFFCVLCFQSILIYHSAWDSERNVAILIFLIGVLLPGIADNPTNITWIATSIALAACLSVGSWIVPLLIKLYRRRHAKDCRERNFDASEYAEVQMQSMDSKHSNGVVGVTGDDAGDDISNNSHTSASAHSPMEASHQHASANGDKTNEFNTGDAYFDTLEMNVNNCDVETDASLSGGWTAATTIASTDQKATNELNNNITGSAGRIDFSHTSTACAFRACCDMRYTLYGLVIMCIGVSCFAFQSRTTYWITHSCWHAITMVSSFFCLKGMPVLRANAARLLREI